MKDKLRKAELYGHPAYGVAEAAAYLKVPYTTLRYWLVGADRIPPIVLPAQADPVRLSFLNLLECHALSGMRKMYDLKLPKVRAAIRRVTQEMGRAHPLVTEVFLTDRKDLFIEKMGEIVNISRPSKQLGFGFYQMFLERVETTPRGTIRFFPFVKEPARNEPKSIEINPLIGFGKPVISGTGISTAIIASRFNARESVVDLAREYGCSEKQIEEAIRWERPLSAAA